MYVSNILHVVFFFLDDNINEYKFPIVSNTNLYEAPTNTIIKLLNENNND